MSPPYVSSIIHPHFRLINPLAHYHESESYKIVRPNDFAYNPMNIRLGAVARHKGSCPVAVSGYYDIFTTISPDDLAFMDSFLTCAPMITYYNKVSTGSLLEKQRVYFSQFLEFSLPLPPLEERKKIGAILSAQDTVIELKERLLTEKRRQKKWIMQRLLTGKQRLPGFTGEWATRNLRQTGTLCSGTGFPDVYQGKKDGKIPFYKVSDMNTNPYNRYLKEANNYIDNDTAKILHAKEIPADSIVFAKVGGAILLERKRILSVSSCIDNNMMAFIPSASCHLYFIYYWFLNTKLSALIHEGALPSINAANVGNLKIGIPPLDEQMAIADILSAADREIDLLRASLEQEKRKKKALSQLLLTGIVRV